MELGAGGPWTSAVFTDGQHGWAVGSGVIARTTMDYLTLP
jgi:hypothetical protein